MPTGLRNFLGSRLARSADPRCAVVVKSIAALLRRRTLAGRTRLIGRLLTDRGFGLVVVGTALPESSDFDLRLLSTNCRDKDPVLLREALMKRTGPLSGLASAQPYWVALQDDQFQASAAFLRRFNLTWCLLLPWPGEPEPAGIPFLLVGGVGHRRLTDPALAVLLEAWALLDLIVADPLTSQIAMADSEHSQRIWRTAPTALAILNGDEVVAANAEAERLLCESIGRGNGAWRLWLAASARRLVASGRDSEILPATASRDCSLEIRVGDPVGTSSLRVVAVRDATAEVAADSRQAETISTLSHELRTPLTSLKNGVQLVLGGDAGPLTDQQQRLLELAQRNTDRLERLITDLLDVARAEAGRLRLNRRPLDLAPLLREALETFILTIRQRDLTVDDSGIPDTFIAHVDGDKVVQMLHNVVGNALKYTREGGFVRVWVQERGVAVPPEAVWLADQFFLPLRTFSVVVEDNGRGMDQAVQERAFEPFSRGNEVEDEPLPGAGLGLHITKSLVEIHGGSISLDSQRGLGTTVWIVLPRDPDSERVLTVSRVLTTAAANAGTADLQLAALDLRRSDQRLEPTELAGAGQYIRRFLMSRCAAQGIDSNNYVPCCEELTSGLWVGMLGATDNLTEAWAKQISRPDCPAILVGSSWFVTGWQADVKPEVAQAAKVFDPAVTSGSEASIRHSRSPLRLPNG